MGEWVNFKGIGKELSPLFSWVIYDSRTLYVIFPYNALHKQPLSLQQFLFPEPLHFASSCDTHSGNHFAPSAGPGQLSLPLAPYRGKV